MEILSPVALSTADRVLMVGLHLAAPGFANGVVYFRYLDGTALWPVKRERGALSLVPRFEGMHCAL